MEVPKLRRGLISRLFGDAMPLGLSSQFLVFVAIGLLSPIEGWRWLPLVLVVSLVVIAVEVSPM